MAPARPPGGAARSTRTGLRESDGPHTGQIWIRYLREVTRDLEVEREVFRNLPTDPRRRLALAMHIMAGVCRSPEDIRPLTPAEDLELLCPQEPEG